MVACRRTDIMSVVISYDLAGGHGRPPSDMAKKMMDALYNFGTNNSVLSLKAVRIVIYQPSMHQEYSKYAG